MAGVRGNYHFATTKKFDPYIGVSLGYNAAMFSGEDDEDSEDFEGAAAGGVFAGGQIGANYYFSPKFGAWAEVGYGIGYVNLGVTIKF